LAGYLAPSCPKISEAEYIALVDWTGRQWHPTKRGKIARSDDAPITATPSQTDGCAASGSNLPNLSPQSTYFQ